MFESLCPFFCLLRSPQGPGHDSARAGVDIQKVNALACQQELAHLVRVSHTAGFEDIEPPVALPICFDITEHDPGIHERGDADCRFINTFCEKACEKACYAIHLHEINEAGQDRLHFRRFADGKKVGYRVDDHNSRFELLDELVHHDQVHLKDVYARAHIVEAQKPFLLPWGKVNAYGAHVSHDLLSRFLESKIEATLATLAGLVRKVGRNAGLPRAGRPRDQNAAPAIEAPSQHGIQTR